MTATEPTGPTGPIRGGGRPHRPPPRPVEVVAVEHLTPRLVSVIFGGEALAGFRTPPPTAHIKLLLPDAEGRLVLPTAGPDGLVWPEERPTMRTYTPRRYDPGANTLEVWFALHGEGPAARWAREAAPGARAAIGGPGGRFQVDPAAERWWIGGDESALPAIATLIEALPATAAAQVHVEVEDAADELTLPAHPGVHVTWRHRTVSGDERWGGELLDAVEAAELDQDTQVWVGCEAAAVRRIRAHLLTGRGLSRGQVTTRGYWRLGEANHPDHDFGED